MAIQMILFLFSQREEEVKILINEVFSMKTRSEVGKAESLLRMVTLQQFIEAAEVHELLPLFMPIQSTWNQRSVPGRCVKTQGVAELSTRPSTSQ